MARDSQEGIKAPNVYFDPTFRTEAAKLLPGEYFATGRDILLVTVLGSCVSACVRDPVARVGGMNHFMLPHDASGGDSSISSSARYGSFAMEVLINNLIKMGGRRERFEAKLFGGGSVIKGFTVTNIGQRNACFATDYMQREGIRVLACDLLDDCPRKVYFFPLSGRVLVKKLRGVHNDTIVRREQEYASRLNQSPLAGDVELFD
jgi:chemotaxis protein CheD